MNYHNISETDGQLLEFRDVLELEMNGECLRGSQPSRLGIIIPSGSRTPSAISAACRIMSGDRLAMKIEIANNCIVWYPAIWRAKGPNKRGMK